MTKEEFESINWKRGNVAKLNNGKEYLVKGTKGRGRYILLYSEEYDSNFVADYNFVAGRTSDYEEPEDVYLEMKRQKREAAEARMEAERQERLRIKAERKGRNLREQERIRLEAKAAREAKKLLTQQKSEQAKQEKKAKAKAQPKPVEATKPVENPKGQEPEAPKAVKVEEPVAEAPKKRVRQRIKVTSVIREKIDFFKRK